MPIFETPSPIDLAIKLPVGRIEVFASDRTDTVVTVAPTNPDKAVDKRGADETKLDLDGQRLTITGPKPRLNFIGPTESVDLTIELPTASRVTAELSVGGVRTTGRLGATRIKALTGAVEIADTADLSVRAGHGSVIVGTIDGDAEIIADHGQIRLAKVTGDVTLKASHGGIQIGESGGDVEAKLSYGDLEIETAKAGVTAKTAYGSIRLNQVASGSIQVETGYGPVTIGVKPGTPAWLDLSSKDGRVRSELEGNAPPKDDEQSVAVRARTQYGDITITKASKK